MPKKKELEPEPHRTVTQPPRPRIPGAYAVEGLGTGDEVEDATEAEENGDDVVAHPVNEDNDLQSGELQNAEPLIFSRRTRIYWRQRLVLFLSLQATVALAVIVVILLVILMVSLPRNTAINQSASQQDGAFQISTSSRVASQSPKKFLVSVNLPDNTMQAMERPQSPQSKAYQWLTKDLNNQSSSLQQLPDWRLVQRFALATFYYSTRGDHWVKHHGWLDWDTNECDWELIFLWGKVDSPELYCNDKGEIKGLEFGHTNNLEGTLSPEISLLGNSLQALGFLREFQLEGTIPTEIGLLTKLTRLELGAAALSGTVQTEFGCVQSLEQLVMSSVSLPSELGKVGNLTIFKVVNTDLTGSLPVEVCRMHQLTQIVVMGSPGLFSGSLLPEIIRNMPKLQLLVLDQRKSGDKMTLPSEIGLLSELSSLYLIDRKLDGTVPKQLGHLTDLKFLTLKGNSIAGTMHPELFDLTNLISLDIEANQMKGSLPRMLFSKLKNLQYLRIN
ncbi:Leucine Rich Repeat [Seminavis robusta]|uniref:Leucine Rich Repeat n=1 Tax=Seminavis robusta TaxID=568900 RepID=A0A9N8ETE1_9STRA|nr:Leucine Rich Repeat [Seminavis robusta]|eukprot:Sro1765_g296150.1 Leucine Rich Repeat (502) ;mRNA; f:5445-7269